MKLSLKYLFTLIIALSVAGCSDNSVTGTDDDESESFFSVTISGDVNTTAEGVASFVDSSFSPDDEIFVLLMTDDEQEDHVFTISRENGTRPAQGSHPIGNEDDNPDQFFAFYSTDSEDSYILLHSLSGTLEVTASSDSQLAGSFNIQFAGIKIVDDETEEVEASATGEFNVVRNF